MDNDRAKGLMLLLQDQPTEAQCLRAIELNNEIIELETLKWLKNEIIPEMRKRGPTEINAGIGFNMGLDSIEVNIDSRIKSLNTNTTVIQKQYNNSSGGKDSAVGIPSNADVSLSAADPPTAPSKPEHLICQKCQNKVCMCMCEKVVWTDELLAEACEKMSNDVNLPDIDGGRLQPCLSNQLSDLAKALRERGGRK